MNEVQRSIPPGSCQEGHMTTQNVFTNYPLGMMRQQLNQVCLEYVCQTGLYVWPLSLSFVCNTTTIVTIVIFTG